MISVISLYIDSHFLAKAVDELDAEGHSGTPGVDDQTNAEQPNEESAVIEPHSPVSTEVDPFEVDEFDSIRSFGCCPHSSSEYPLTGNPARVPTVFTHSQKVPGSGDTALRICNDGPLRFLIIGELASHETWNINKVGPYLDCINRTGER